MKLLDELEKLHREGTQGPWAWQVNLHCKPEFNVTTNGVKSTLGFTTENNARLIVHAVNNLPKLIEVIRKQRDRLKEFELDMCPEIRRAARQAIAETDKILGGE